MTKFITSEAISWSRRAISGGATKKVLKITLTTLGTEPRRSSMARRSKTWNRRVESWGKLPNCLSGGSNFKVFLALSFERHIFFPSSSLPASSCCEYSSTVFQPHSHLSANKINFCLFVSGEVFSNIDSFLSTELFSSCAFASSKESHDSSLLFLSVIRQRLRH